MDNDFITGYDAQGWRTRDYTSDAADLARQRAGVDITGTPVAPLFSGFNSEGAHQLAANANAATLMQASGQQQQAAIAASSAMIGAGTAVQMAQTPLTYDANNLPTVASQRTRASFIPGGAALYDSLTGGRSNGTLTPIVGADGTERYRTSYTTSPIVTSQDGTLGADLGGSKKGAATPQMDLMSDPRFRTLMATNPDNAKRFYSAVTGRDHDTDLKAAQALLDTQNANQLKLGQTIAQKSMVATKDNPDTGVKKGDIVKQEVQPGLVPGTVNVAEVPLTPLEAHAMGIYTKPDGSRGYIPGSYAHRAFGTNTVVDTTHQTDMSRIAELQSKRSLPATAATSTTPDSVAVVPTAMDKLLSVAHNFRTTVNSTALHPVDTVLRGGANTRDYMSPADIARLRTHPTTSSIFDNMPTFDQVMAEIAR